MLKTVVIILLVAVLAVGAFLVRTVYLAGYFRTIEPRFDGTCRLVDGPVGPEDLAIDRSAGVAYISATDRRAVAAGNPRPGAIYSYDLNAESVAPINLTADADTSFQPHGISLWTTPDHRRVLYVINHPAPGTRPYAHSVEVFDILATGLRHRSTIIDARLIMPNDLVAVDEDRFYLTNTHRNPPGRMQTVETYLRLRGANVLYYGRQGFEIAADDLILPNGINVSPNGKTIYVASTTMQEVQIYDRDPVTGALQLRGGIPVGSGLDNIDVDEDGNLWIGAHPNLMALTALMDDPTLISPSQALRVSFAGEEAKVDEVYLDRGEQISGVSVAARAGDRLLLGQIFGNGILDCTVTAAHEGAPRVQEKGS
jgi:arylesterase/paraoxonase